MQYVIRSFQWGLVLCLSLLARPLHAEGRSSTLAYKRVVSVSRPSEALLGVSVQCQREETRTGCLPGFGLEQGITRSFTVGFSGSFRAEGLFPSTSDLVPKFILGMSANHYGMGGFHGLWLQLNLRDKFYSQGGEAYSQVVALSPMVGWRWITEDHPANFALSMGVEKNLTGRSDWLILARAEVGLRFLWGEIFN